MQIRCPKCQTQIDCETIQISGTAIVCPDCETQVNLQDLIDRVSISVSGEEPQLNRTQTLTFSTGEIAEGSYVGKFKILSAVGKGGFGNVYRAYDEQLKREVALKIPRRESNSKLDAAAFLREAQMAASVRDPNIVTVLEVGSHGETTYICSDFIEGQTLKAWFRNQDPSLTEICRMIIQVARSLHRAHQTGLVHRDLKPANILVDEEGNPYITDFGLARKVVTGSSGPNAGKIEIVGTPAYMSPEQAVGDISAITTQSDIYSLGVILYELSTKQRPFHGEVASIIQDILYHDPPRPVEANREIPRVFEAIVLKAMAKEPKDRYETAEQLADDLENFLAGEPTLAAPLTAGGKAVYLLKKNRWPVAISVTLVVAIWLTWLVVQKFYPGETRIVEKPPEIPAAKVSIVTEPARATVAIVPINPDSRRAMRDQLIQPGGVTPLDVDLPAGDYIVEAWIPGLGVQEVRRTVLPDDADAGNSIEFDRITIKPQPDDLPVVNGGTFEVSYDAAGFEKVKVTIADFYVQPTETTCGEYKRVMGEMPVAFGSLNRLPWNDHTPVTRLSMSEAREFAEKFGMRLIDYEEFCYLATNKGTTDVPWGNLKDGGDLTVDLWIPHDVTKKTIDRTLDGTASQPVYGLYSNVAELTGSTIVNAKLVQLGIKGQESSIVIVGIPVALTGLVPTKLTLPVTASEFSSKSAETVFGLKFPIGFRCVRSVHPRFIDQSLVKD